MDVRVDDKVAIVTGGSRGIGKAIASELLASGARGVVITSRKPENIDAVVQELAESSGHGDRIHGIAARADDAVAAETAVRETIERFASCDILVNNAGTNPAPGHLGNVSLEAVDKTWAVNQRGPLIWSQQVWQQWMQRNGGVIINTASVGGLMPSSVIGAYNVSKAALIHMTRQLALEMAPGVRVNAVAPAVVKTKLSEMLWINGEEGVAGMHPLGRLGEVEDVAHAVVFLCSEKASWITGVTLPVDGGSSGATAPGGL